MSSHDQENLQSLNNQHKEPLNLSEENVGDQSPLSTEQENASLNRRDQGHLDSQSMPCQTDSCQRLFGQSLSSNEQSWNMRPTKKKNKFFLVYRRCNMSSESKETILIRKEDKFRHVKKLAGTFEQIHKITLVALQNQKVWTQYSQICKKLKEFSKAESNWLFLLYLESDLQLFFKQLHGLGLTGLQTRHPELESSSVKCSSCEEDIDFFPVVQRCFHSFHFECITKSKKNCTLCVSHCLVCSVRITLSDEPKSFALTEQWKVVHEQCLENYNEKITIIKKKKSMLEEIHPTTLSLCCSNDEIKYLYKLYKLNRELEIPEKLTSSAWKRAIRLESLSSQLVREISKFLRVPETSLKYYWPKKACFICLAQIEPPNDPKEVCVLTEDFEVVHHKCTPVYRQKVEAVIKQSLIVNKTHPTTLSLFASNKKIKSLYKLWKDSKFHENAPEILTITTWMLAIDLEAPLNELVSELSICPVGDEKLEGDSRFAVCSICLVEITQESSHLTLTPCFHLYHTFCIENWKILQKKQQTEHEKAVCFTCPYCRLPL